MRDRWDIIRQVAPYFGRSVPARFVQRTSEVLPAVTRIHNLIQGIYKPRGSDYALTIASMLENPYADRIEHHDDRTWSFYYSPKTGSLDSAVNRSLFNCMRDDEPVMVIKQLSDKTHRDGTRYQLLGLGRIEDFESTSHLFKVRELTIDQYQERVAPEKPLDDELIETALRLEALKAWAPFVSDEREVYKVSKVKRDAAFRKIVLSNYRNTCAITRSSFSYRMATEAQAAHIISKQVNGSDDPRNGIAMSHTSHWAFDHGLFTVSDQFEILVHPLAREAKYENFPILELDRSPILLPDEEFARPHIEALRWHKEEVFGRFAK